LRPNTRPPDFSTTLDFGLLGWASGLQSEGQAQLEPIQQDLLVLGRA